MNDARLIASENARSLPANIRLISTPDFAEHLRLADRLTRDAPCNVVVNNFYAESPRQAALRAFLRERGQEETGAHQPQETIASLEAFRAVPHAYFTVLAARTPPEARHHVADLLDIYAHIADGIETVGMGSPLGSRMHIEDDNAPSDLHFDVAVDHEGSKDLFMLGAQKARALIQLHGKGAVIVDTTDPRVVAHIGVEDKGGLLKSYNDPPAGSVMPPESLWMLAPLSIAVVTKHLWPHIPTLHGTDPREPDMPPQRRALHVLDMPCPRG